MVLLLELLEVARRVNVLSNTDVVGHTDVGDRREQGWCGRHLGG
jgi:hypothetical protein